jgi:hypothetical protein
MTVIYGLRCPIANCIRYIGKANDPQKRLALHLRNAPTARHHCGKWIAKLLKQGLRPTIEVLHDVGPEESWEQAEIRLIAEYRAAGAPLTNMMDGGQGWRNGHPEVLQRMRESLRRTMMRPEMREKSRQQALQNFRDPEIRSKPRCKSHPVFERAGSASKNGCGRQSAGR